MKTVKGLLLIWLGFLLFTSCAGTEKPVSKEAEKALLQASAPKKEKPIWGGEWQELLKGAAKEGRVSLVTGYDTDTLSAIRQVVKNKFNLEMEWRTGRPSELAPRVIAERRAGIYSFDVYVGTTQQSVFVLKPVGAFLPLRPLLLLPEVLNEKAWLGNELPFVDRDEVVFQFSNNINTPIAINTTVVRKDEIKSHSDLLDTKWKGKLLMDDPTISGSAMNWSTVIGEYYPDLGWGFQKELARQEPMILRDARLEAEWLARGKYAILIVVKSETKRMRDLGAPIEVVVPKDGNYLSAGQGTVAYFDKAPHPKAAQVFINWFLTREGQEVTSRSQRQQSSRVDIPVDFLPVEEIRENVLKAGGTFINPNPEEFEQTKAKSLPKIKDIWGALAAR